MRKFRMLIPKGNFGDVKLEVITDDLELPETPQDGATIEFKGVSYQVMHCKYVHQDPMVTILVNRLA